MYERSKEVEEAMIETAKATRAKSNCKGRRTNVICLYDGYCSKILQLSSGLNNLDELNVQDNIWSNRIEAILNRRHEVSQVEMNCKGFFILCQNLHSLYNRTSTI